MSIYSTDYMTADDVDEVTEVATEPFKESEDTWNIPWGWVWFLMWIISLRAHS